MSSSISDDIFGDEFLNHDTDHTSPLHSPTAPRSRPPVRPKPANLSPTHTSETVLPVRSAPAVYQVPGDVSRCVIAVDYGTTFTGVAIAITDAKIAETSHIELMQDYGERMSNQLKVPSVYSYSLCNKGEKQWGLDVSEGAVTMVNTKMQFDVQERKLDELETTLQILQGTGFLDFNHVKNAGKHSGYTWKAPVEVAADYLTKVRERICLALSHVIARVEIDIVVTVPVGWSDRATELTFKAFDKAGFNRQTFPKLKDIIRLTEPEAASYFTALDNREAHNNFLKRGEVFILCDAGGGTVDVIAYAVKSLEPHLELVQVSEPSSVKCGGSFVDANFKGWLRHHIGRENFAKLDRENALRPVSTHTSESGPMRELMKRFDAKKKTFSSATQGTIRIDLPPPLDGLHIEGRVRSGELMISPQEMGNIFSFCVNTIVEQIDGLAERVSMDQKSRIKNCFLVGGFGESPYLQELLKESMDMRSIELRAPNTRKSWTAAAQGAAIYGIEKGRHPKIRCMQGAISNYGIMINESTPPNMMSSPSSVSDPITNEPTMSTFSWLIKRGDLVMSDDPKRADKWFRYVFKAREDRKLKLQIYEYTDEDDKLPVDFLTSQKDVETMGHINCDLAQYPLTDFGKGYNDRTHGNYHTADLRCKMSLSQDNLEVEVLFKKNRVGYTKINVKARASRRMSSDSDHFYMDRADSVRGSGLGRWSP